MRKRVRRATRGPGGEVGRGVGGAARADRRAAGAGTEGVHLGGGGLRLLEGCHPRLPLRRMTQQKEQLGAVVEAAVEAVEVVEVQD